MNDKSHRRRFPIPRSRSMRFPPQRARVRHIVLALLVLFVFLSFRATKFPAPGVLSRKSSSTIQASFLPESAVARSVRLQRQGQVKDAFQHAWKGYKEHAWLHDEVSPISGGHKDTFVGWAATLVDALDTLYIMGLQDEFEDALKALEKVDFSKPNANRVPVFETTIRYLGGLLGAWDVSGHKYPILLEKATQLGDFLYRAFDTESGIPVPYYPWKSHGSKKLPGEKGVIVSQIGSLSLEFIRLSQVTGDAKYAAAIQNVTDQLEYTQNSTALPGMWPTHVDCTGPTLSFSASNSFTLGALAGKLPSCRMT
jgi:mannosyl-oligosaccharide alpha-1,2-mannosidase